MTIELYPIKNATPMILPEFTALNKALSTLAHFLFDDQRRVYFASLWLSLIFILLPASGFAQPWNSPYVETERVQNTLYKSFSERPKHLDPARSYSSNEWIFIQSIYETPLQYHYLKRPYTLIPSVLEMMPEVIYYNEKGEEIALNSEQTVAFSKYILSLKPNILYQFHPAFVAENLQLSDDQIAHINTLGDIQKTATRELVAQDFVHQIKRLAHPSLSSPVLSLMSGYIVGLSALNKTLVADKSPLSELEKHSLAGVKVLNKYQYSITVKGVQKQFLYWLAMPFFTAMPPEADKFYGQQGLIDKNIILDWYPIGTGAFVLSVNQPNKEMVLSRNPNFHAEFYPNSGQESDGAQGLLADKNKKLPFLESAHFLLEKEAAPYWHKFLQGYYDSSGIASDNFDQAIEVTPSGQKILSKTMRDKHIRLLESPSASVYYTAFNMQDKIVGGYSVAKQKLRQAISLAINTEEYISIFLNGRASPAHGPIPTGIFGAIEDYNPFIYHKINGKIQRKSLTEAKRLMHQAGYPNGIDSVTKKPLVLYFDTSATGASEQPRLSWLRAQFKKIGIQIVVRASSYNRFQDKLRKGQAQLFELGWNADYPDPENFLFLLVGKNAKTISGGENTANYQNATYDALFEQMKNMPDNAKRQAIISQMVAILRQDSPWVWGYIPQTYGLYHRWLRNTKPHAMARNTLKYVRIDAKARAQFRLKENQIVWWPLGVFALLIVLIGSHFWRRRL